jgi:2-polyprenyl-3-methyl-5-hydroxy-6-metoxy-1,4-benzoquinol methylase
MNCVNCGSIGVKNVEYPEGTIYRCLSCRLQWAVQNKNIPSADTDNGLSHYMTQGSIKKTEEYGPYNDFFDFMGGVFKNRSLSILDVGCGNGNFIKESLRRGHDVSGIERNLRLKEVVSKDVLDRIIFKPVEEISGMDKKLDVITFWDSFEHLENSFLILDKMRGFLKPEGCIYLRINNNDDIYNRLALFSLSVFPPAGKRIYKKCFNLPQHTWNFSRSALESMLKRNGWEVMKYTIGETPSDRLTPNPYVRLLIDMAYMINKFIGSGKIGNVYIKAAK